VEAAQIATRAGLAARAQAETLRAVTALSCARDTSHAILAATARTVADLVRATEPQLAERLRDQAAALRPGQFGTVHPNRAWSVALPDGRGDNGNLHWWLDPRVIPPAVFRHGYWPSSELTVQAEDCGIVITAELAPDADHRQLEGCRARLVEPGSRGVVGSMPFRDLGDSRVRAEIHESVPPGDAWVEVVGDENRPVLSGQLHHIRRAMRWADAALSASRLLSDLDEAEWARLAAAAWKRCTSDWSAARDADRAYLAAANRAAMCRDVPTLAPPSAWAKELADRPSLEEEPFLAEQVG
jgi:hypothetical protein